MYKSASVEVICQQIIPSATARNLLTSSADFLSSFEIIM